MPEFNYPLKQTKKEKKHNYCSICNKEIGLKAHMCEQCARKASRTVERPTREKLKELITEDSEIVSIYYGADVNEDDANEIVSELSEIFDGVDIEVNYGGQPIYYYIVSVE